MSESAEQALPLKRPPKYGCYLRWPMDGTDWIHPEDVETAEKVLPGYRIFKREDLDAEYMLLSYADLRIRVRPTMWTEITTDGYEVGDQVEVRSRLGQREPMIATIRDILWNPESHAIEYHLHSLDRELRNPYAVDEFQPAFKLDEPMTRRQMELAAKFHLR